MASSAFGTGAAAPAAAPRTQWYYYLQNDPRGLLPDGWYEYDPAVNRSVEQLYQYQHHTAGASSRQLLPMTASSGFQYELDFHRMIQRNTASGKERPISRTTNGLPPNTPAGSAGAFVGASFGTASAPTAPAASAPSAPHISAFGSTPVAAAVPSRGVATSLARSSFGGAPVASSVTGSTRSRDRKADATRQVLPGGGMLLTYTAPKKLHEVHVDETQVFVEVPTHPAAASGGGGGDEKKQDDEDKDCVVCLDALWEPVGSSTQQRVVALKGCSHEFHYTCIHACLTNSSTKCPLCSKPIQHDSGSQTPKGQCPSGTMVTTIKPHLTCEGHAPGTIQISYQIPSGTQQSYHPHPGERYHGATRVAYLPNNPQGQELVTRMQYAFGHGLTFMVGTSLTTSQPNCTTWASIHHKTNLVGGATRYGFPDTDYFPRCHAELNGLGVPDAAVCQQWIQNL